MDISANNKLNQYNDDDLLSAALFIIQKHGLAGLTIRPLAKLLDTNVAMLARKLGSKSEILNTIIRIAAAKEAESLILWRKRLENSPKLCPEELTSICDDIIRNRSSNSRLISHLKCELIQASAFKPELREATKEWLTNDRDFFYFIAQKAELNFQFDYGLLMESYLVDEISYSLTMENYDCYRMIRSISLRRFWQGLFKHKKSENPLFNAFIAELGEGISYINQLDEKARKVGNVIIDIIMEKGLAAITHREVSSRTGIAHTSLAYHYPTQDSLVELGVNMIIDKIRNRYKKAENSGKFEHKHSWIAFANYSMAVTAASRQSLVPIIRDMRRRRGENLQKMLISNYPTELSFDLPAVQFLSCCLMGLSTLNYSKLHEEISPENLMYQLTGCKNSLW
jgi:AcrR family transcriptional regulator